jgi:hypothetical protein
MTDGDWAAGFAKSLAVFLNGDAISEPDPRGERIGDESFLLLFNAAEHGSSSPSRRATARSGHWNSTPPIRARQVTMPW